MWMKEMQTWMKRLLPATDTDLVPETSPCDTSNDPETEQAESSKKVTLNLVLFFVTHPGSHVSLCVAA